MLKELNHLKKNRKLIHKILLRRSLRRAGTFCLSFILITFPSCASANLINSQFPKLLAAVTSNRTLQLCYANLLHV